VALAGTALVSVVFSSIFQMSELFSGSTNGFYTQLTLKKKIKNVNIDNNVLTNIVVNECRRNKG